MRKTANIRRDSPNSLWRGPCEKSSILSKSPLSAAGTIKIEYWKDQGGIPNAQELLF
nr:MAG TPA: hypothetical protein [Caudoviricetes sp.]